ncbi:MAG: SRPBCC domain-containing protein [Candidatus Bathyarchaeia archaeon]
MPHAKPTQVYRAFLNAKIHSDFTGSKATGKARVRAKFTAWDGYISGKIVELKSGKRIVQEWRTTEFPAKYPDSRLDLKFQAKKGGTQIVMVHSRVPASQTSRYREGWVSAYWDPLKEYFRKVQKTERS